MRRSPCIAIYRSLIVVASFLSTADAQSAKTIGHKESFVVVEPEVRLEVLDWGGAGRGIVLLSGLGGTAHRFDGFAEKLTDIGHVYGITRRGFGESSQPKTGYNVARLAEDVAIVIRKLKLHAPVLIGESLAGEELTAMGGSYADLVSTLIYLDARMIEHFYTMRSLPSFGSRCRRAHLSQELPSRKSYGRG